MARLDRATQQARVCAPMTVLRVQTHARWMRCAGT